MPPESPTIDYNKIAFPSDRLTLKTFRSLSEVSADGDVGAFFKRNADAIFSMYCNEEGFADLGFARGLGNRDRIADAVHALIGDWDEAAHGQHNDGNEEKAIQAVRDKLASSYVQFGVAPGPEVARQLIRKLEDQGVQQSRDMIGRAGGGGN